MPRLWDGDYAELGCSERVLTSGGRVCGRDQQMLNNRQYKSKQDQSKRQHHEHNANNHD